MKYFIFSLVSIFLTSCGTLVYYQVYEAKTETGIIKDKQIIFEYKNCRVIYDLWDNGGDIGFSIYNKTESDLIIDLTRTFYVLNGITYDYFKDRTFSNSSSSATAVTSYGYPYNLGVSNLSRGVTSNYSVTYKERPERIIPPNSMIKITEYEVTNTRYIHCDLKKYPSRSDAKSISFSKSDSPFVFKNLITYSYKGEVSRLENSFFVTSIGNYPSQMMVKTIYKSECGNSLSSPIKVFNDIKPDKFYYEYFRK